MVEAARGSAFPTARQRCGRTTAGPTSAPPRLGLLLGIVVLDAATTPRVCAVPRRRVLCRCGRKGQAANRERECRSRAGLQSEGDTRRGPWRLDPCSGVEQFDQITLRRSAGRAPAAAVARKRETRAFRRSTRRLSGARRRPSLTSRGGVASDVALMRNRGRCAHQAVLPRNSSQHHGVGV
jgi:hypothetical protein